MQKPFIFVLILFFYMALISCGSESQSSSGGGQPPPESNNNNTPPASSPPGGDSTPIIPQSIAIQAPATISSGGQASVTVTPSSGKGSCRSLILLTSSNGGTFGSGQSTYTGDSVRGSFTVSYKAPITTTQISTTITGTAVGSTVTGSTTINITP